MTVNMFRYCQLSFYGNTTGYVKISQLIFIKTNIMRLIILILLLLLSSKLMAPEYRHFDIPKADKIVPFDKLLHAFMFVESGYRSDVVNSLGFTGILQEGKSIVDDANRILVLRGFKPRFNYSDRLDSTKSVLIWYAIQSYYNLNYSVYRASVIWNPKGGKEYFEKIKKAMK